MFRILTYNIHGDVGPYRRRRETTKRLHAILQKHDADIICLQEMWGKPKTGITALELYLKDIWPHFSFAQNAFFPKYHLGNAIFSRFEIIEERNYQLNTASKESRGLLWTKVQTAKEIEVNIFCTHLSLREKERINELTDCIRIINDLCPDPETPLIFCGDFNDWQGIFSKIMQVELNLKEVGLESQRKHFKTFPTFLPLIPLDRIYFRGLKLELAYRCKSIATGSDHRPIFSQFSSYL